MVEEGVEKKKYLVVIDDEDAFNVDIWWSVNLPNNPSYEEILEEWILDNYGYKAYKHYCLDDLDKYVAGAVGC